MAFLLNLLYGAVLGFTEFLPISSSAHSQLFASVFGDEFHSPALRFATRIAVLFALLFSYYSVIVRMRREKRKMSSSSNRRVLGKSRTYYDLKLVKSSAIPLIIGLLIMLIISGTGNGLVTLALFSILNGIILFVPSRMLQGNKTAKHMSGLDSILIGVGGALSIFSGISRIGSCVSFAISRAADRKDAYHWALLLSFPALILFCVYDLVSIINASAVYSFNLFYTLVAAVGAFAGAYGGITLMRSLIIKRNISDFAYYSWGVALLACILYLIV